MSHTALMVTILFVLGFAAVVGVAVWTSRRAGGTGPSRSNGYLGSGSGIVIGDTSDSHHHQGDGGWSGGDGGGWSGGGGDGGGGGGGN